MFAPPADSPAILDAPTPCPAAPASPARDTILVVEDEDFVAGLIGRFLERGKFQVLRAASGGEAERLFQDHRGSIALAMIDVTLPDMHGGALARALRERAAQLPLLFVSGRDVTALREAFSGQAPTGFVAKPFFPAEVVRQVQALIAATV